MSTAPHTRGEKRREPIEPHTPLITGVEGRRTQPLSLQSARKTTEAASAPQSCQPIKRSSITKNRFISCFCVPLSGSPTTNRERIAPIVAACTPRGRTRPYSPKRILVGPIAWGSTDSKTDFAFHFQCGAPRFRKSRCGAVFAVRLHRERKPHRTLPWFKCSRQRLRSLSRKRRSVQKAKVEQGSTNLVLRVKLRNYIGSLQVIYHCTYVD